MQVILKMHSLISDLITVVSVKLIENTKIATLSWNIHERVAIFVKIIHNLNLMAMLIAIAHRVIKIMYHMLVRAT